MIDLLDHRFGYLYSKSNIIKQNVLNNISVYPKTYIVVTFITISLTSSSKESSTSTTTTTEWSTTSKT